MHGSASEPRERLLVALAEQLKLPLLQIARDAELSGNAKSNALSRQTISKTADVALRMIDGFILSVMPAQKELQLEPVSVSAVLQDTAHRLNVLAKQYDCDLELSLSGKYGPVMANKQNLEAALTMLGYAFIEAQPADHKRRQVILAAHKSPKGLVTGIFGSQNELTSEMFRRAKALYGTAKQPLTSFSPVNGAGVFIADSLLQAMASGLHPARHNKFQGLAATLLPSYQLKFGGML